jgi:2-methylcitrate dehydratase PrpD
MNARPDHRVEAEDVSSVTSRLADVLRRCRFEDLPAHVVAVSKHCLLDWFGVTLAGSREPAAEIMRTEALAEGSGQCTLVGTEAKASPFWAALANGTASHALDFDDVVAAMAGHPTVPVVPALLALAEVSSRARGRDFVAAFVAGFEAECRIGALMGRSHYERGFHVTSTVGTFGAATACAHWLGLSLPQWQAAFGLAGTQASGLKCMFGTMTKPYHAGKAAANGLLAARLAAAGFTAHPEVLETDQGFAATQSDKFDVGAAFRDLGERFGIADVLFKYHAACYLTHGSIEALLKLKRDHGFAPDQVDAVRLRVAPGHLKVCNIQDPATALEAKFSLRFTAAMALADGDLGEGAFTDECVRDPRLTRLRDKVTVEAITTLPDAYVSEVDVTLSDGTVLKGIGDTSKAAAPAELDRQWDRLVAKFTGLAAPVVGASRAAQIVESVGRLDACDDIREIVSLSMV